MTVKDFLKGRAFRSIVILTVIALCSGLLLAICNDLLAVSDTERTQRAIKEVYGKMVKYEDYDLKEENKINEFGTIDTVYLLEDGNYLIKSTGKDGYKNGTVTCWVAFEFNSGDLKKIKKVVLDSYDKQTLMSQFGSSFYKKFASADVVTDKTKYFTTENNNGDATNIVAGATYSSTAIDNSVNSALYFVRNIILGGN